MDTPETASSPAAPQPDSEHIIRFDRVAKRFGDNAVLRELDFSVKPGEHTTLIGPSGSGKTTILRLLMTLERADSGTIRVGNEYLTHMVKNGRLVAPTEKHLRTVRQRIGMVFQQLNLFPNMKVLRNITEAPVHVLGLPRDEAQRRGRELLEMVGLEGKADAHPTQLSGGQQQRVAIARALAMEPDVLLLDEVTSALDPELVAGVLNVLRDVARSSQCTILCVTHEMRFAQDISQRVLMFDHGQILEEGTPEKLLSEPDHERTRSFLHAVIDRE